MTAYNRDPRVRQDGDERFEVYVGEVRFAVLAGAGRWFIEPPYHFDMYARARFNDPYPTADEAIRALIGDPR